MSKKVLLLTVMAIMFVAGNVWAADPNWLGGTSINWFIGTNWSTGVAPTALNKANINQAGTYSPTISAAGAVANKLYVAEANGGADTQILTVVSPGTLDVNQEIVLGFGGSDVGTLLVTSGTVDCNHLFVGYNSGSSGHLHIDSGTVTVQKMFGLSWNGGDGYAQLDGGTLHTEQFAFENNKAGGTAEMKITAGTWQQEHYWWDKIKSLVWYGKIIPGTGYGDRTNVVVTWDPTADSGIGHTIVTAVASPTVKVVKKAGGSGIYTTIQSALDAAAAGDLIEVQDSQTYNENLVFPANVSDGNITLQAGDGYRPTIALVGEDANKTKYIAMNAPRTTIQGFNINLSSASTVDGNTTIIFARGGASTVRDCNIVGPSSFYYIRGIAGVATIDGVQLSNCRAGILCDANEKSNGFRYSISGSHIYNCEQRGIFFSDCNAVMDNCLVELCGTETGVDTPGSNVLLSDSPGTVGSGTLNVLITNSTIQKAIWGRNVAMESKGKATINDSKIMDALGTSTHSDEILQYCGTLNLNRCIIKAGKRCGVNLTKESKSGGICYIDHCDFYDPNMKIGSDQWAVTVSDGAAVLTITNSILTGENGFLKNSGTFTSNYNDNFCLNTGYNTTVPPGSVSPGTNDIVPKSDPFYIQTNNPADTNFFKLQPYSPVIHADSAGSYMGSQGILAGQEKWPADLDAVHGVDFRDFAVFASNWQVSHVIAPIPSSPLLLDNFNSPTDYNGTGNPATVGTLLGPRVAGKPVAWRVVPWSYSTTGWAKGTSTLSLLTVPPASANDVNSGTKAMWWRYDVNTVAHEPNGKPTNPAGGVGYTEICVVLNSEVDFSLYNEIRVSLKRLAGNSVDTETFLYAKFLNDIYGTYGKGGLDLTGPDARDVANSVTGGQTATPVGVYSDWVINLANLVGWTWSHTNLQHVGAIIFGLRTQALGPYGMGKGTIYVDDIRLVDRPGCSSPIVGDLSGDCKVNFADLRLFATYWLMGK